MPRGGKRPGAGKPKTRGEEARAVTVRLTREEDAQLTSLELAWREDGASTLRRALREAAERLRGA